MSTPALHREVRDGVPLHWAPLPEPGIAVLRFRVGWADESPISRGLTHLVEHLALHRFGAQPGFALNGAVDALVTTFYANGTPEQLAAFVDGVCAALSDLPLDRVEAESRVLRTEALGRETGIIEQAQFCRYGARGVGVGALPEHALSAPDRARVRDWAAERFTAGNAVAWFSGEPPAGLGFERLPTGARRPCPESPPLPALRLPAYLVGGPGGVSFSFVAPREDWLSYLIKLSAQRLQQRLRYDQGATYMVLGDYHPVGPEEAHGMLWAGCLPDQAATVQRTMFEVLEQLAAEGPTAEELRLGREELAGRAGDPDGVRAHLDFISHNDLFGQRVVGPEELAADFAARDAAAWSGTMARAMRTLLLILPPGGEPVRVPCHPYPAWSEVSVGGRRFRHVSQRFPWSPKMPELVVGPAGATVVRSENRFVTVRYEDCVGAVAFPDGRVWLCGEDGFTLMLDPKEWRRGNNARAMVLGDVPPGRLLVAREQ